MPRTPPRPLVTTTGRVELTDLEIEGINYWINGRAYRSEHRCVGATDEILADVLRRLLGHAVGTLAPRQDGGEDRP